MSERNTLHVNYIRGSRVSLLSLASSFYRAYCSATMAMHACAALRRQLFDAHFSLLHYEFDTFDRKRTAPTLRRHRRILLPPPLWCHQLKLPLQHICPIPAPRTTYGVDVNYRKPLITCVCTPAEISATAIMLDTLLHTQQAPDYATISVNIHISASESHTLKAIGLASLHCHADITVTSLIMTTMPVCHASATIVRKKYCIGA